MIPFTSKEPPHGPAICTADRSPIPCWGVSSRVISAGGQKFTWSFLKAKVAFPILGEDFLQHFDLWVDLRRRRPFRRGGQPLQLEVASSVYVSSGIITADQLIPEASSSSSVEALEIVEALENVEAQGEAAAAAAAQAPPAAIAVQVTCDL